MKDEETGVLKLGNSNRSRPDLPRRLRTRPRHPRDFLSHHHTELNQNKHTLEITAITQTSLKQKLQ